MLPDASAYRLDFVALLLLFYLFLLWLSARGCSSGVTGASAKSAKPQHPLRPLKPRPPADCPKCVCECTTSISPASRSVRPWREYKSSRGRPKRIDTAVYACDNEQCAYCGITDATIHVLVGFGHHGVDHAIQNLFCQACQHKFSVRRHTALYLSVAVRYCTSESRPMCTSHGRPMCTSCGRPMCTRLTAQLLHIQYPFRQNT